MLSPLLNSMNSTLAKNHKFMHELSKVYTDEGCINSYTTTVCSPVPDLIHSPKAR